MLCSVKFQPPIRTELLISTPTAIHDVRNYLAGHERYDVLKYEALKKAALERWREVRLRARRFCIQRIQLPTAMESAKGNAENWMVCNEKREACKTRLAPKLSSFIKTTIFGQMEQEVTQNP